MGDAAQVQLVLNAIDNASSVVNGTADAIESLSSASNRLALAQFNASTAAGKLVDAETALANNKSPEKQRELQGAVLHAQVAFDQAVDTAHKYSTALTKVDVVAKKAGISAKAMGDFTAGLGFNLQQFTNPAMLAGQAVGALVDQFKKAISATVAYGGEVRDFSVALGISTEEASRLLQVADDLEINAASLKVAFRNMAKDGIQPSIASLKNLAAEYQAIDDPVKRSQFAMEAFGDRAGPEMQRLLAATPESIDAIAESAEKAGLVLSAIDLKNIEEYRLAVDDLGDSWEGFEVSVGTQAVPALTDLIDYLKYNYENSTYNIIATQELTEKMELMAVAAAALVVVGRELTAVEKSFEHAAKPVIETLEDQTKTQTQLMIAERLWQRTAASDVQMWAAMDDAAGLASSAANTYEDSIKDLSDAQDELARVSEATASALDDIAAAEDAVAQAEQSWMEGAAGDVADMLGERLGPNSERYLAALTAIDDVYGTGLADQREYQDALKGAVDEYARTGDLETFKTRLGEIQDTWMPLNDTVADARKQLEQTMRVYDRLKSKEIVIKVHVKYLTEGTPPPTGGTGGSGRDGSGSGGSGGEYTPPLDPKDDKPFRGTSPGNPISGGAGIVINVYPSAGMDERGLASRVAALLAQQVRAATTGGMGVAGR